VAAFASGDGGTLVFSVDDDAQVVGINPATLDEQMLTVSSMIRNSIDPEPPYTMRVAELRGRTLLLVEVNAGGRWHAMNPAKPEFYVRRGAKCFLGVHAACGLWDKGRHNAVADLAPAGVVAANDQTVLIGARVRRLELDLKGALRAGRHRCGQ
jgi:Putative DNA-binding domain